MPLKLSDSYCMLKPITEIYLLIIIHCVKIQAPQIELTVRIVKNIHLHRGGVVLILHTRLS